MYQFHNSDKTIVNRLSDNACIPWDAVNNHPLDVHGYVYQQWVADGSPTPDSYVLPLQVFHQQVDAYRDNQLSSGYVDKTTKKTYRCDSQSIGMWTLLASSAASDANAKFNVITADNTKILLSAKEVVELVHKRIVPWISATTHYAHQLKDSYVEGDSVPDITVGWPT